MVRHESEVASVSVNIPGTVGFSMKALIGAQEGWEDYVMRQVELAPGGKSPRHSHPWEHINYVLEGEGVLLTGEKEYPIRRGDAAFVPADTLHQYQNSGKGALIFLCIVPKEGHAL